MKSSHEKVNKNVGSRLPIYTQRRGISLHHSISFGLWTNHSKRSLCCRQPIVVAPDSASQQACALARAASADTHTYWQSNQRLLMLSTTCRLTVRLQVRPNRREKETCQITRKGITTSSNSSREESVQSSAAATAPVLSSGGFICSAGFKICRPAQVDLSERKGQQSGQ